MKITDLLVPALERAMDNAHDKGIRDSGDALSYAVGSIVQDIMTALDEYPDGCYLWPDAEENGRCPFTYLQLQLSWQHGFPKAIRIVQAGQ